MIESNITPIRPEEAEYAVIQRGDMQQFARYVGQLAATVTALQRDMEAIKRENAMRITINHQQAKALMQKMRERAGQICERYSLDERKHGAAIRGAIRRAVLSEYGIQDVHDLPLGCFEEARAQIAAYSNFALVRKRREVDAK